MYKITTFEGIAFTTEKPNFIRVHKNGCYILCDRSKAEGVAYGGTPYLFKDGTMIREIDAGGEVDGLKIAAEDSDAMHVDHEYRLTLLELGLIE